MADACPNCGRADLMQPDVRNYQCLGCGTISDIATVQPVPTLPEPPRVNNANQPVPELSVDVVEQPANEYVPPVPDPNDQIGVVVEPDPTVPVPVIAPEPEPAPEPESEAVVESVPETVPASIPDDSNEAVVPPVM